MGTQLAHQQETGPPGFLGDQIGQGLHELGYASAPRVVSRAISAPQLTRRLLAAESGFHLLDDHSLNVAANTLTFLMQHSQQWRLLWAESVAGPAKFSDVRLVRAGVTEDQVRELGRTVGVSGKGTIWVVASEVSLKWSRLTRSTVSINLATEFSRTLEFEVPTTGLDIAMWQLDSHLSRRLILRTNAALPADPIPTWVETAIALPVQTATVPCNVIRTVTRSDRHQVP